MAGEMDEAKGRIKQAAGELAGDDELKNEGRIDEGQGKVKDFVDKIGDKLKGD